LNNESTISNIDASIDQFRHALKQLKGDSIFVQTSEELSKVILETLKANRATSAVIAGVPSDMASRIKADLDSGNEGIIAVILDPTSPNKERNSLEICNKASAGITWAQNAIASNGALVEIVYDDIAKLASSLPGLHIALLPASGIVSTLDQAFERVGDVLRDSSDSEILPVVSFISGPSKTSDIELKLLYGVHGPLTLYVIILGWA
jgi:L-lactate dehydrogenase complex protein LldG